MNRPPRLSATVLALLVISWAAAGCGSGSRDDSDLLAGSDGGPPSPEPPAPPAPPTPTAAEQHHIRVILKVHIEDLLEQCGATTNGEEATGRCADEFSARLEYVDDLAQIMAERGITLSIHANGDWAQQVANRGESARVQGWLAMGHQIGVHMHSVYETPLVERDDPGTADWCDDAVGNGVWADVAHVATVGVAQRCQVWSDHDRLLSALLPGTVLRQATPYRNGDSDVPAMLSAFGYSILGGGERHEEFQALFGHHPFSAWRIGTERMEEDPRSSAVIVHTHAQLDKASVHGGCDGVFEDRSLGSMQLRFIELYLTWLHAERTMDPKNRVWSFGVVVHDNQDRSWVDGTHELAPDGALARWIDWLQAEWIGRSSARGHTVARWSSYDDVADATNAWYERRALSSPNELLFGATEPGSACAPAQSAGASTLDVESCRSHYPYEYWGMAQAFAATPTQVVQYVGPAAMFEAQGVSCHELVFGTRLATSLENCGDDYATTIGGPSYARWVCWKETDGEARIDLNRLSSGGSFVRIDPRTGAAQAVGSTRVNIAGDPLIVQLADAPLYGWQMQSSSDGG